MDYMDRQKCYFLYFYTRSECSDCPKLAECKKQEKSGKNLFKCSKCGHFYYDHVVTGMNQLICPKGGEEH